MIDLTAIAPGARLLYDNGDIVTITSVFGERGGSIKLGTVHGYLELCRYESGYVTRPSGPMPGGARPQIVVSVLPSA